MLVSDARPFERLLRRRSGGVVARLSCRQRHLGRRHFRCMAPCRLTRIVRDRSKSCPCNRTTMRSIARAPYYRHTERLVRGRSGGVARFPRRQRHLG